MKIGYRGLRPVRVHRVVFCAAAVAALAFGARIAIDSTAYLDEVKYLAAPELKGRLTGSPELEQAAGYLRAKYESFGLKPAGNSFEQAFQVTTDEIGSASCRERGKISV